MMTLTHQRPQQQLYASDSEDEKYLYTDQNYIREKDDSSTIVIDDDESDHEDKESQTDLFEPLSFEEADETQLALACVFFNILEDNTHETTVNADGHRAKRRRMSASDESYSYSDETSEYSDEGRLQRKRIRKNVPVE